MKRSRIFLFAAAVILPVLLFVSVGAIHGFSPEKRSTVVSEDTLRFRSLLILRHAKSDHDGNSIPDFDRPLSADGRKEAEEIGEFVKTHEKAIDLIVASPSMRTRQTIEIVCKKSGYSYSQVQWDSSLYQCNSAHFIDVVRQTDNRYHTVLFVGHNSAITDVVNTLQSNQQFPEIKTCGLVDIFYENARWSEIGTVKGVLSYYRKPK